MRELTRIAAANPSPEHASRPPYRASFASLRGADARGLRAPPRRGRRGAACSTGCRVERQAGRSREVRTFRGGRAVRRRARLEVQMGFSEWPGQKLQLRRERGRCPFPSARHKWSSSDSLMRASARRSSASCWSRATCVDAWTVSRSRVRYESRLWMSVAGTPKMAGGMTRVGWLTTRRPGTHVVQVQSVLDLVQDTTGHCCKG